VNLLIYLSMVVVALGEPGTPVTSWAIAPGGKATPRRRLNDKARVILFMPPSQFDCF